MAAENKKMTAKKLAAKLVEAYSEDDKDFTQKALWTINDYYNSLPKTSKIDPDRLNSKAVFVSELRNDLLQKVGPIDLELKAAAEFNQMTVKEQLRFQARSRLTGENKWVHRATIIPENLSNFFVGAQEMKKLAQNRAKRDNEKLKEDVTEIDGDRLLAKLGSYLDGSKWKQPAAALLLMTGRRTIEVLKTAEFYLLDDMTEDGYRCQFRGQAKAGLTAKESYEIPLLAPFSMVSAALALVRKLLPIDKDVPTAAVNKSYAGVLGTFTKKIVGLTPHELRAAYAVITYELLEGKKPARTGHIGSVLGQDSLKAPVYYTRMAVTNLSGPYTADTIEEQEEPEKQTPDDSGWVANGAVEKKRLADVQQMIMRRMKITASSLQAFSSASMPPIYRFIANNMEKLEEYNRSLGKDGEHFAKKPKE